MTRLTDALKTVHVYNAHYFYNGDAPASQIRIEWRASDRVRAGCWMVVRTGYRTDPGGDWVYNYNRTFSDGAKADALEAAKAWAGQRYGVDAWAKDPFGSYGDAGFVEARVGGLSAAAERKAAA